MERYPRIIWQQLDDEQVRVWLAGWLVGEGCDIPKAAFEGFLIVAKRLLLNVVEVDENLIGK